MNAVLGAKDEPRYLMGGIGEVRGQLEAEQDQRQGHLHLNHGKLLPNAVPHSSSKRQKGVRVPARYVLWRKPQWVKHLGMKYIQQKRNSYLRSKGTVIGTLGSATPRNF